MPAAIMKETGSRANQDSERAPMPRPDRPFWSSRGAGNGPYGLRPQAINVDGGFRAKGRTTGEPRPVICEARARRRSIAPFCHVIERASPEDLAADNYAEVSCPTIARRVGGLWTARFLSRMHMSEACSTGSAEIRAPLC